MTAKKRAKFILYSFVTLAIVIIIFYPRLKETFSDGSNSTSNPTVQRQSGPAPLNVQALIVKPSYLSDNRRSTGTLLSDEETELSFETSGRIVGIYFIEGTHVKKGELMAKINDLPLQAQLQRLQAQKRLIQEREFRQRSLLERDAISQESYDQVVTELQVVEADIALVEARISETELRAPFNGIVGLRQLSEGSYVSPNTKIARLVKNQPIKIEFSVAERYSGELKPGFPIQFFVEGVNEPLNATVYAIDPKIDIRTRSVAVRAIYPNTNEELRPGSFAEIELQLHETYNAIAVPTESIIPEMDGEKVFVFNNGRAEQRFVTTGLRTESHIQILSGLEFGDTLLTSGMMQIRPNMPVEIYYYREN